MPKYTVTSPIKFKGKRVEIDGSVEMPEDVAQPLIKSGALKAFVAPADAKKDGKNEKK